MADVDAVTVACIRVTLCVDSTTKSSKWDTTRSLRYNQDSQREEGLSLILQPVVVNKTCASYLPKNFTLGTFGRRKSRITG